ncbi:MAG: carbohydrate ABC transporter permease [Kiritimatiellae bacterium]|nr:carbohydrate ABC transporter permease [Kiritimatiellia bacterium]
MVIIRRLCIYALLIIGAVVFIIPLVWMISTALKPIEQTMTMPPTWVPYQLYTDHNGVKEPVRPGERIEQPSLVVQEQGAGQKRIVPVGLIREGQLVVVSSPGKESRRPVIVIEEIPATPDAPWIKVFPEGETGAEWKVVPVASMSRNVSPRWGNFYKAVKAMKCFGLYLKNTLLLCVLTVIGTVSSSALAAYGFSRIEWRGRDQLFVLALATMMVPFPVVMVPLYCLFKWLGWIGTLRPLWVGSFFAGAFNVFLLRQFFRSIPRDLSEAARIDGCSEFRIFWQIILPLCKPALMVVGLFQFMATWNDFLGPLIYLTDQQDFTLALGLQFFQSQHGGTEWNYLMAASTLVALPIIALFFFTQKSFIEGISMTGLKG